MMKTEIIEQNNEIVFFVTTKIYPLEVVLKASYIFIDRMYIHLDSPTKTEIRVSLKGKQPLLKKQLEGMKGDFLNELLNAQLRTTLSRKNQKVIECIVGAAISAALEKTPKEKPEDENRGMEREMAVVEKEIEDLKKELEAEGSDDYKADPLNIRRPHKGGGSAKRQIS